MPLDEPRDDFEPLPLAPTKAQASPAAPVDEPAVNIPFDDVKAPVQNIDQAAAHAAHLEKLRIEAEEAVARWSRSSEKQRNEDDRQHQERIKREFEEAVMAVRRQETAAPRPPMHLAPDHPISKQTQLEMEAGRKQSQYWAEQAKFRPQPTAKEIQAAGTNTPVFRPGEFMHEKGGVEGKHLVSQNVPGR